jgi:hypothetical protein
MKISDYLHKEPWKRRVSPDYKPELPTNATFYDFPDAALMGGANVRFLTQSDFLNELSPAAREINNKYWSAKPIKSYVEVTDENGDPVIDPKTGKQKKEIRIVGFEDMETTRCCLARRFAIAKASHAAADGYWIGNESKNMKETFDQLLSWKDSSGLDTAYFEAVLSLRQTCDAAIYLYTSGGNIEYKVFSYLYGDELFPRFDENRKPLLARKYVLNGKLAVDIYKAGSVETWVQSLDNIKDKSWLSKISGWVRGGIDFVSGKKSEDGWTCIASTDSQITSELNQCIYFRVPDLATGDVEEEIRSWERATSYIAEAMKSDAFPDKFVKSTKIKELPNSNAHGRIYGATGTVEELKVADVKTIDSGDMSNIATVNIKTKMDNILHGSMSVIIEPEILKSGADSSSALRLMFTSEIQCAQEFWVHIAPGVRYMTEVFKYLVAKVEKDEKFAMLRTSVGQNIWVPQNTSEKVENTTKLVYAGILSRDSARSEMDMQYPDDDKRVISDLDADTYRKTYQALKAQADAKREFGDLLDSTSTKTDDTDDKESTDTVDNRSVTKTAE